MRTAAHRPVQAARQAAQPAAPRNNRLAVIHIAKAQLGMDDETYRAMLWGVARVRSAKELDHAGRERVIAHLVASGFKAKPPKEPHAGRPRNMDHPSRGPLLGKIEALLLDAGRDWAYGHGMAKRMHGVADLAFCHEGQLYTIVQALEIDKRRRAGRGQA
jgi:phage gp16-like protein